MTDQYCTLGDILTQQCTGHHTGYCLIKMPEADVVSVKDHVQLCFGKELNTCTCWWLCNSNTVHGSSTLIYKLGKLNNFSGN